MTERVTVDGEPSGNEPEGHEERMRERAGQGTDPQPTGDGEGAGEGELILGKFKTQEDLAAAYKELESKLGQRSPEGSDPAPAAGEGSEGDPEGSDPAAKKDDLSIPPDEQPSTAGIDFDKYGQSFMENGELSEDDYTELQEKHNIPRDTVDLYLDGIRARADKRQTQIFDAAGGQEQYNAVRDWAKANLNEAEKTAYNKAITSGSPEEATLAVQAIRARFAAENGSEPDLVSGRASAGEPGFESWDQVREAMKDARYKRGDPAYHKMVERKLANKTF